MNMEGQTGVWLLAALLVAALMSAEAQNTPRYFEVGGKLVLEPKPFSDRITSIVWKLNGDFLGEWAYGTLPLEYYRQFKGRASLDTTTGVLEIINMKADDSGLYTVEINLVVQDGGYDAKAIKQVPKPVVIMRPLSCNEESNSCVLSCDGDITGAEPVTFYWKKGDGQWEKGEQNIIITKETSRIKTFSCRLENPLGVTNSESVENPMYIAKWKIATIIAGVAVGCVSAAGTAFVLHHQKQKTNSRTVRSDNAATSSSSK